MRPNPVFPLLLSTVATLIPATANARTNVGLVDYAYVSPDGGDCVNLSPNKYESGATSRYVVQKDSAYEVTLKRVKMDDFYADFWNPSKGEFAVVARAFEMSADPGAPAGGLDFRPDAANSGRVIYYSNDVRQHQVLNFGQIPMFGPIVYNGNPVGISLFVLEIDTTGDKAQMSTLLSTLASIGQVVSMPTSPIFGLLENLGSSLINANKDDLLFRYDTTLRSNQGSLPNIQTSLFRYGDYVLIRKEARDEAIPWSDYGYDPKSGVVYKGKDCKGKPLDAAYGVIQINRAHAPAYYHTELLGNLLVAVGNASLADQKPVVEAIHAAAETMTAGKSHREFIQLLDSLQDTKDAGKAASVGNKAKLASHLREAKANIDLINSGRPAKYTQKQLDQIIVRLRNLTGDNSIDYDQFDQKIMLNLIY